MGSLWYGVYGMEDLKKICIQDEEEEKIRKKLLYIK